MARKKRCVGRSWRLPGCSDVMLPGSAGAGGEGGRMLVGKVSHSERQQRWRSTQQAGAGSARALGTALLSSACGLWGL